MKIDGRTLDHATLEQVRLMAIKRVREGEEPTAVIASYGFCRTTIYKWMHLKGGPWARPEGIEFHPGYRPSAQSEASPGKASLSLDQWSRSASVRTGLWIVDARHSVRPDRAEVGY